MEGDIGDDKLLDVLDVSPDVVRLRLREGLLPVVGVGAGVLARLLVVELDVPVAVQVGAEELAVALLGSG